MFKSQNVFTALFSVLAFNLVGCVSTFNPPPGWGSNVDVEFFQGHTLVDSTSHCVRCNHVQLQTPDFAMDEGLRDRLLPDPFLDDSWLQHEQPFRCTFNSSGPNCITR